MQVWQILCEENIPTLRHWPLMDTTGSEELISYGKPVHTSSDPSHFLCAAVMFWRDQTEKDLFFMCGGTCGIEDEDTTTCHVYYMPLQPLLCVYNKKLVVCVVFNRYCPRVLCRNKLSIYILFSVILHILSVFLALYSKMSEFAHSPCLCCSSSLLSIPNLQPAHSPCLYFPSSLLSIPELPPAHLPCMCCSSPCS